MRKHMLGMQQDAERQVLAALTLPVVSALSPSGMLEVGPRHHHLLAALILVQEIVGGSHLFQIDVPRLYHIEDKVTKKRENCKRKVCFSFAVPSASNFGEAKVTKNILY